jgi:putative aminopeptidase FrvX
MRYCRTRCIRTSLPAVAALVALAACAAPATHTQPSPEGRGLASGDEHTYPDPLDLAAAHVDAIRPPAEDLPLTGSGDRVFPPYFAVNPDEVNKAAADAYSYFLDEDRRIGAIATFEKLVAIKGPSGQEAAIRDEVRRMLLETGAKPVPPKSDHPSPPLNLVMEIPGSGTLADHPAIILNAHLDTIRASTPELIAFDSSLGDFYHQHETVPERISSFGGDDRTAVAAIVEAIRFLRAEHWIQGVDHRRIVLIFTAEEEFVEGIGMLGAKYLTRHEPQVFRDAEITISMDGPIDLQSGYPEDSFVAVVASSDAHRQPYRRALDLMTAFCERTNTGFTQTEVGLGMGDFAYFPGTAKAGLHLRSPVRGWHNKERVNVQDQINHVDLLIYLLLAWDRTEPVEASPGSRFATASESEAN